ncbi:membrane protein US20 [Cercopithecine betaherpesvirus 5]|uniref:Membrane protein US20 n=1 Tax=Simian cytomegalovirus (strain Colburn) TaxID=50292 RepID=G8XTM6_SCMVC|nr:membrane protein US20 [Cercopithecine betaherpesvirus 5]AEV80518.1 membrane protein US20 [Cercopithecine betaherpesvirus 5]
MLQQENAGAEGLDSPLLMTADEALAWFKKFVVWMRIYGVYVFALSLTFGAAGLLWLGYPQSTNLCVMNHGVVLTMFVPILCMITLYLLGPRHPSNLTVLLFYIAVNCVPTVLFNLCSDGYTIMTAYIMSVATFISFTGLTFIGGMSRHRWKWIIAMYIVLLILFLLSAGLQAVPWHTKLVVSISAFSVTFFAFILAYDTSMLIYHSSFMYCIRTALRLYVDTIAIFLVMIFMMSMPKWVEQAKNVTVTAS